MFTAKKGVVLSMLPLLPGSTSEPRSKIGVYKGFGFGEVRARVGEP